MTQTEKKSRRQMLEEVVAAHPNDAFALYGLALECAGAGDTEAADKVIYRGDVEEGSFSVWWLNEQRLDAAFIMNRPDEERKLAPEWIRARRRIQPEQLQDASISLGSVVLP